MQYRNGVMHNTRFIINSQLKKVQWKEASLENRAKDKKIQSYQFRVLGRCSLWNVARRMG